MKSSVVAWCFLNCFWERNIGVCIAIWGSAQRALYQNDIQRNRCSVIKLQISTTKAARKSKNGRKTILWKSLLHFADSEFTSNENRRDRQRRWVLFVFSFPWTPLFSNISHNNPRPCGMLVRAKIVDVRLWQRNEKFPSSSSYSFSCHPTNSYLRSTLSMRLKWYKCKIYKTCGNLKWKWFSKCWK